MLIDSLLAWMLTHYHFSFLKIKNKKQETVDRETPTRVSTKRQKNWLKKCFYSEKVLSQGKITCSFEVVVVDLTLCM